MRYLLSDYHFGAKEPTYFWPHSMRYHRDVEPSAEPRHLASAQGSSPQEELVTTGTIVDDIALHGACAARIRRFLSRSAECGSSRASSDRLAMVTSPDRIAA
jgi:hypothetical protein